MRLAIHIVLGAALLLTALPVAGQTPDKAADTLSPRKIEKVTFRAGLYGAYAYNMHTTTASVFTSGLECGAFNDGNGNGFAAGGFVEVPLLEELLDLHAGVGFIQRGGTFGEVFVGGLPILDPNTDQYTTLERKHGYTANLSYLQTEFGVRLTIPWFPLYIKGTAGIGFPQSTTFEQVEEIIAPVGVVYPETNTIQREVGSGDLQDPESMLSAAGAIGYEFPLSTRMTIAPEVSYYHPFSDVTLNRDWKVAAIQGGAALRWNFGPLEPLPTPEPPPALPPAAPDVPPAAPSPPTASVRIGSPKQLSIVETIVTETFPILPYVFFDSGQATIPRRYNVIRANQTASFDENNISWRSLEAYYNLLNILGKRMVADPSIQITVNGTTDGREASSKEDSRALAEARAGSIKQYLVDTWKIDPDRVAIRATAKPEFPSSEEYQEGFEENRRVEIKPNDPKALRPIVHERFNEYSFTPDQVKLNMDASSSAGISSWQLTLGAGGKQALRRGGEGNPPGSIGVGIDQESAGKIASGISGKGFLDAELSVKGGNGLTTTESTKIPTTVELNPFEVSRLSLIVFDFDKAVITPNNRTMVKSFVADALKDGSSMTIVGSTDRLGEEEHNKQLSKARAETVQSLIAKDSPGASITNVEGVGTRLRYDNSTPEGRYYCRTVTVEVKTPIEEEE